MKKGVVISMALTMVLAGCKKYPEGPLISFRSSLKRITGTWKVDKLYINNVDSTDEYNQKIGGKIEFTKDKFQIISDRYIAKLIYNDGRILNGYWYFEYRDHNGSKFNGIVISFAKDTTLEGVGPLGSERGGVFKIRRLTNREFIFEESTSYNAFGKTYKLELTKE